MLVKYACVLECQTLTTSIPSFPSTLQWQSLSSSSRRGQYERGGQADDNDQGEEEDLEVLLTPEMQGALRESKWLQGALGDSTLRRLLADIDGGSGGAGGSLTGRGKAARLKEALEKHPDLQAFVDRMLMEVGALKYEDGRLVLA